MTTAINLDRERALRLAREVRRWHRRDDDAGSFDCWVGMVRAALGEAELVELWAESKR